MTEESKWIIACIFLAIVLAVAIFGLILNIQTSRLQREIREMCNKK